MLSRAFERHVLACLCLALFGSVRATAEDTWREVRSPHFRVLTNSSEGNGRTVAFEFEQMRHVFATLFGKDDLESGAPLTIVAARDGNTLRELEPALWKHNGQIVAGEFHRGWDKQFALTRMDTWGDQNQVVIYHEYSHSMLHANTRWLPVWLDEGLAEFYGYTRFEHDRTLIGAPSARMGVLRSRTLLPLQTMLSVTDHSPEYHDEYLVQLFYGQAWAMVHYMIFGPGMESGQKLRVFLQKIGSQEPQLKAFTEVFGDPKAFDQALSNYISLYTFKAGVLPPDPKIDPKTFTARLLTPAEAEYELGCFHIGAGDRTTGRALIQTSLKANPNLAGAHEELGYAAFEQGKDEEAVAQWKEAVALDPSLPRANYALAMSTKPLVEQSPDELRGTRAALQHVTELAPKFAPAYVQLALCEWRLGMMNQAFKDAHKAEALEPARAGYHTLTGNILLQGKQPAMAANYSRYVAEHWFGPDHNEAVDLWNAVPAADRGTGAALAFDFPAGTRLVRGRLAEMHCAANPGDKFTVTLQPAEPKGTQPLTFTASGGFMSGWSDTLWWGSDHYSLCQHLTGKAAVVAYQPVGNSGGTLMDLEIRDDLPMAPPVAAAQTTTATSAAGTGKTETASNP